MADVCRRYYVGGESASALAKEVGVSRPTMYEWLKAAKDERGLEGLPIPVPGERYDRASKVSSVLTHPVSVMDRLSALEADVAQLKALLGR